MEIGRSSSQTRSLKRHFSPEVPGSATSAAKRTKNHPKIPAILPSLLIFSPWKYVTSNKFSKTQRSEKVNPAWNSKLLWSWDARKNDPARSFSWKRSCLRSQWDGWAWIFGLNHMALFRRSLYFLRDCSSPYAERWADYDKHVLPATSKFSDAGWSDRRGIAAVFMIQSIAGVFIANNKGPNQNLRRFTQTSVMECIA